MIYRKEKICFDKLSLNCGCTDSYDRLTRKNRCSLWYCPYISCKFKFLQIFKESLGEAFLGFKVFYILICEFYIFNMGKNLSQVLILGKLNIQSSNFTFALML